LRSALACVAALLWQAGNFSGTRITVAPLAEPQHLRYERSLKLPKDASGTACAVLDASVFVHAAGSSLDDLRVFSKAATDKQREIPFAVSYSAAQPTDATAATSGNVSLHGNVLNFDLAMPHRLYTTIELKLAATNFMGTAKVSGSDGRGGPSKPLGTFEIFDLTQQHLARSTVLALQESSFPVVHVTLRLYSPGGKPIRDLSTAMVEGATVPASREAQTLYTVVATSRNISQQNGSTIIKMVAAAHVPVERVRFELAPAYKSDFLRHVSITAASDPQSTEAPQELLDGEIWRVTRSEHATGGPGIRAQKLTLDAVLASNLHDSAKIKVNIKNDGQPPLSLDAVELEMRQRTLCFHADAGATYTLRYGDPALQPSVYDFDSLRNMPATPIAATLGMEELNRHYVGRSEGRTYQERNPEMYWIALLAAIATLGAIASTHTKHRGRHR
jgi:hypothetical protein